MSAVDQPVKIKFCVPWALSYIMQKSFANIEALLIKDYLGPQPVAGISIGVALKCLIDKGYKVKVIDSEYSLKKLPSKAYYLIHVPGHVGVIFDHQWFDNSNPGGCDVRKRAVLGIYEVTR